MSAEEGGRVFFSNVRRSLEFEDEIILVSVGVDIGSSTSHLVFSRLLLERLDNRYVVSERVVLHESEVLLTPYAHDQSIDAGAECVVLLEPDAARVGQINERRPTHGRRCVQPRRVNRTTRVEGVLAGSLRQIELEVLQASNL